MAYYMRDMGWSMKEPTVMDYPGCNPHEDAAALRAAMKGFGTDEKAIINILCSRSNRQRQEISQAFNREFNRDLIADLKSELGGCFEDVIIALMLPPVEYLCKQLNKAMKGAGTDDNSLTEILCSRGKREIQDIVTTYEKMYSRPLTEHVCSETSGDFRRLLTLILTGVRDHPGQVNPSRAAEIAQELYNAGEGKMGTSEEVFVKVFGHESFEQLALVFQEYKKVSGKSIEQSLKSELSGDFKNALLTIVECVQSVPAYYAKMIQKATNGMGTNDNTLIRIIVSRSEVDLKAVKREFERIYDKTLESIIKGETSGDYKKALMALLGPP